MDLSTLLTWVAQAGTTLRQLPMGVHGGAIATLIAGLILWLFGSKVLKPVLALAGAAIGGALGTVMVPNIAPGQIGGIPSQYAGLGIGIIVGILGAMIFFRFAMAAAGGVGLAIMAALGAALYLSFTPGALPLRSSGPGEPGTTEQIGARLHDAAEEFTKSVDDFAKREVAVDGGAKGELPQTGSAYKDLKAELADVWSRTPDRSRIILIAAAGIGALAGILIGQIMPTKAAAVLTAMAGSGMALASGDWLARAFDAPFRSVLDSGPLLWLSLWAVATFVGVVVQFHRRKPPESQAKPA